MFELHSGISVIGECCPNLVNITYIILFLILEHVVSIYPNGRHDYILT